MQSADTIGFKRRAGQLKQSFARLVRSKTKRYSSASQKFESPPSISQPFGLAHTASLRSMIPRPQGLSDIRPATSHLTTLHASTDAHVVDGSTLTAAAHSLDLPPSEASFTSASVSIQRSPNVASPALRTSSKVPFNPNPRLKTLNRRYIRQAEALQAVHAARDPASQEEADPDLSIIGPGKGSGSGVQNEDAPLATTSGHGGQTTAVMERTEAIPDPSPNLGEPSLPTISRSTLDMCVSATRELGSLQLENNENASKAMHNHGLGSVHTSTDMTYSTGFPSLTRATTISGTGDTLSAPTTPILKANYSLFPNVASSPVPTSQIDWSPNYRAFRPVRESMKTVEKHFRKRSVSFSGRRNCPPTLDAPVVRPHRDLTLPSLSIPKEPKTPTRSSPPPLPMKSPRRAGRFVDHMASEYLPTPLRVTRSSQGQVCPEFGNNDKATNTHSHCAVCAFTANRPGRSPVSPINQEDMDQYAWSHASGEVSPLDPWPPSEPEDDEATLSIIDSYLHINNTNNPPSLSRTYDEVDLRGRYIGERAVTPSDGGSSIADPAPWAAGRIAPTLARSWGTHNLRGGFGGYAYRY